jgi:glutathione peroxidase
MKTITILLALGFLSLGGSGVYADDCSAPLSFDKRRLAGDEVVNLCDAYQGKVVSALQKLL